MRTKRSTDHDVNHLDPLASKFLATPSVILQDQVTRLSFNQNNISYLLILTLDRSQILLQELPSVLTELHMTST